MTGFAKFTPLPLVELYVELQADEAEISQAYSYNILISTLVLEQRGHRQAAHVLPSIGDAPLPGRVDCGWAHGAPIDVEARVHVGISVLALFAHHSCEPLFAGSNQTPATVVTINNITYLEGRGFLPHHPLHQQV